MIEIKYTLDKFGVDPIKKHDHDAGYDLKSTWRNVGVKYTEFGTGVYFEIPDNYVGLLFPINSITETDYMLKNCVGVINSTYKDEIKFKFIHAVHDVFANVHDGFDLYDDGKVIDLRLRNRLMERYNVGDIIGQIIFLELPKIKLIKSNSI